MFSLLGVGISGLLAKWKMLGWCIADVTIKYHITGRTTLLFIKMFLIKGEAVYILSLGKEPDTYIRTVASWYTACICIYTHRFTRIISVIKSDNQKLHFFLLEAAVLSCLSLWLLAPGFLCCCFLLWAKFCLFLTSWWEHAASWPQKA